jgi:hypothetical protein
MTALLRLHTGTANHYHIRTIQTTQLQEVSNKHDCHESRGDPNRRSNEQARVYNFVEHYIPDSEPSPNQSRSSRSSCFPHRQVRCRDGFGQSRIASLVSCPRLNLGYCWGRCLVCVNERDLFGGKVDSGRDVLLLHLFRQVSIARLWDSRVDRRRRRCSRNDWYGFIHWGRRHRLRSGRRFTRVVVCVHSNIGRDSSDSLVHDRMVFVNRVGSACLFVDKVGSISFQERLSRLRGLPFRGNIPCAFARRRSGCNVVANAADEFPMNRSEIVDLGLSL